jgi:hypothetical protein
MPGYASIICMSFLSNQVSSYLTSTDIAPDNAPSKPFIVGKTYLLMQVIRVEEYMIFDQHIGVSMYYINDKGEMIHVGWLREEIDDWKLINALLQNRAELKGRVIRRVPGWAEANHRGCRVHYVPGRIFWWDVDTDGSETQSESDET